MENTPETTVCPLAAGLVGESEITILWRKPAVLFASFSRVIYVYIVTYFLSCGYFEARSLQFRGGGGYDAKVDCMLDCLPVQNGKKRNFVLRNKIINRNIYFLNIIRCTKQDSQTDRHAFKQTFRPKSHYIFVKQS